LEEQKLDRIARTAEEAAYRKIEKTKIDQARMLTALSDAQLKLEEAASTVESHSTEVEKVSLVKSSSYFELMYQQVRMVINSALASRISWEDIEAMVRSETAAGAKAYT
jgi:hypothetical protein